MAGPEIKPDPDLRAAESGAAPELRTEAGRLFAAESAIDHQIKAIANANEGRGTERVLDQLSATKASLDRSAVMLIRTAELYEALATAAATFRSAAPTGLEIFAAWVVLEKARSEAVAAVGGTDGPRYLAAKEAQQRAQLEFDDLGRRRNEAIAAFESSRGVALERYQHAVDAAEWMPHSEDVPLSPAAPRTATPPAPAPEASAQAPTPLPAPAVPAEFPRAATPSAPPPDTNLAAVTGPGGGLTPAQAAVLGAALSQQQGQSQQQPAQIPQPQMAAPAPALAPPQQQRRAEDPSADYDPNAVLAGLARGDFRPATATVAAPAITPLNPPPTFTPLSPGSSLSGLTQVNPVVAQPVVTGTSTAGLITDNNVSGRPDGATARTATSPGAATNLSGAVADQATARPAAAGAGTGVGGVPPMMGPMMGGMGGASGGKDREPVTATMTPDQAKLLGLEAVGEAVPGGTIARKDDAA